MAGNYSAVIGKPELAFCACADISTVECEYKTFGDIFTGNLIANLGFRQSVLKVAISGLPRVVADIGVRCHVAAMLARGLHEVCVSLQRR